MADGEQKLDAEYLGTLMPRLSASQVEQFVTALNTNGFYVLSDLSDITDAQLDSIGIVLGVRHKLLRQGRQLLHTRYPPHRIPPLTAGCRCVRAPARADAAVAPVTATVTGPALLLPTPFGPQATSLLTALLLHLSVALCLSVCRVCLSAASGGEMGCRAQTNSHGKTSAAPAAEHSSPVRSLPLSPPICLCLLRLGRASSCVSSQRLEEVGADRRTTSHGHCRLQWLSHSVALPLSLCLCLCLCLSLCLCLPTGGWLRELTRECVEANPGPVHADDCKCMASRQELLATDKPTGSGKLSLLDDCPVPQCGHLVAQHGDAQPAAPLTTAPATGQRLALECDSHSSRPVTRTADSSHGNTSAAPAAELSSPVRSLPLSPLICLCLLRLDRASSCVSSQRLEEVGADRCTTCAWPRSTAVAVTLSRSPSVSLSLSLSLSLSPCSALVLVQ